MTRRVQRRQVEMFRRNDPAAFAQAVELWEAQELSPAKRALAERLRDDFNTRCPVGACVVYTYPGSRVGRNTTVSAPARIQPSGAVVVELDGEGRPVELRHVQAAREKERS